MTESSAAGVVVIAHVKAIDRIDNSCVLAETKEAQVLVFSEIGSPVVAEDELIRVIWVSFTVLLVDDIVVLVIDLLSDFILGGCRVTLVIIAEELDEI
jgi:hypothetical protein